MAKEPFYNSLLFSLKGLKWIFRNERNFQLEIAALFLNLFLILFLRLNLIDAVLILLVSAFVLVTEIINTTIEKLCDFVEPSFNKKIGIIKDISAGAVLLSTIFAIVIGAIIYWPYLEKILSS
ncbi:diacylglycerol kinase [Halpernia sp.]|uniref:diacylglycerol kinase n=1 Tax=Halpernia sp. TaxID=2782209 RepID=UPI003A9368F4